MGNTLFLLSSISIQNLRPGSAPKNWCMLTPPPPPPPLFSFVAGEGEGEIMGEGLSRVGESSINPCSSCRPAPPRAAPRRPAPPRAAPRRPAPPRAAPRPPSQTAQSVGGGRALYKQRREVGRVPRTARADGVCLKGDVFALY